MPTISLSLQTQQTKGITCSFHNCCAKQAAGRLPCNATFCRRHLLQAPTHQRQTPCPKPAKQARRPALNYSKQRPRFGTWLHPHYHLHPNTPSTNQVNARTARGLLHVSLPNELLQHRLRPCPQRWHQNQCTVQQSKAAPAASRVPPPGPADVLDRCCTHSQTPPSSSCLA